LNPYYNPLFLIRLLHSYLTDITRIWDISPEKLKKFQNKMFVKTVKHAYTVPLYQDKYQDAGVKASDIKDLEDIKKLPIITKDDLRNYYPDGLVSKDFDKDNAFLLSTSGSSGKPVFIYYDYLSSIKFSEGYIRSLKILGGDWKHSKICIIVDMKPGSVERASYQDSALPFVKKFIKLDNIKYIHVGRKIEKIIKEVNEFKPEFLGSDPNMLRELAYKKQTGELKVQPKFLFSGGAMLDDYRRQFIEKNLNAKILDNYGTTEGGPIGFQCMKGNGYHIHSDFAYLEFLDENGKDVKYNNPGRLIVTRLYGRGTPIIRYDGLDDIVTPIKPVSCCNITTNQMIKKISGRSMEFIKLPSGKLIAPFKLTTIPASVMDDFKTYKIKQFQIIQTKINEIIIKIVIDEKLRTIGPSVEKIIKELIKRFREITLDEVKIKVQEVKEIHKDTRSDHVKLVLSNL